MIDNVLKNYKYVKEYDASKYVSDELVNDLLQRAWKVTPSKNNFMPYEVHVLGPTHQNLKDKTYKLCLKNESKCDNVDDVETTRYTESKPNFWNIISCSHLLIFTQRVEDNPNPWQKYLISQGRTYSQTDESKIADHYSNALLEIGFFSNTFAALCIESEIDISFTLCFPSDIKDWEQDFKFLKHPPRLLMTIGKGLVYRQPIDDPIEKLDLKPDYSRIVNFVK